MDCVNCDNEFDIAKAENCGHDPKDGHQSKVCPHCGKCACTFMVEGNAPFGVVELNPPIRGIGHFIFVKSEVIDWTEKSSSSGT